MKYAFIKAHGNEYKTLRLIATLGVSPSGYYDWLDRSESNRVKSNRTLVAKIQLFHQEFRGHS